MKNDGFDRMRIPHMKNDGFDRIPHMKNDGFDRIPHMKNGIRQDTTYEK